MYEESSIFEMVKKEALSRMKMNPEREERLQNRDPVFQHETVS